MKISDYEFINNIDALFEKKIVIYGAGMYGKRIFHILQQIPVEVEFFVDRNPLGQPSLPIPVLTVNELKEKIQEDKDYFIIIGTSDFFEEIISELEGKNIHAYTCMWNAVRIGIEFHIDDERFSDLFRHDFLRRKHIFNQNFILHDNSLSRIRLSVYPDSVLVYQVGKVGSKTVSESLKKENVSTIHVHYLMKKVGVPAIDQGTEYIREQILKNGIKIISLVREPIARTLASYMQGFSTEFLKPGRCVDSDIGTDASKWVTKSLEENEEFMWFDQELKELTGVDIYQYPFDQQQGYAWIKEGKMEILLLKLEMLDQNVDKIGKFVKKPGMTLNVENRGLDKASKFIYQELKKNIRIPSSAVKKQYENNPKFDHFYSEQEKQVFLEKWEPNVV